MLITQNKIFEAIQICSSEFNTVTFNFENSNVVIPEKIVLSDSQVFELLTPDNANFHNSFTQKMNRERTFG